MPSDPARVESFGALQAAVDVDQHVFERFEINAAQAVAKRVVAKGPLGADPLLQEGVLEIGLQLLEAGEAEGEGVEEGEEDGLRRNVGSMPGVGEASDKVTKAEGLIEVSAEARKRVRFLLHSNR